MLFDNRFNSKKTDSLVEAVKQAQRDGDIRRQAEAAVNEAFGVYSRKAVVREHLASYDAAIEEAYKYMKEGEKWEGSKEDKDEDAKLAKKHGMTMKQWEKSAADKKHDAKEKDDKDDKKEKMDEKKDCMYEGLDPVGKEDGDVDNDGDKDKSDKYLLNRRKAIGRAMGKRMEEAAYSAKAARAGKDIGKPGKSFKMIAKKAGERYGSEERGKKVAGAILKRIRAKHMEESAQIDELSAFGREFAAARKAGQSQFMSKTTGKMTSTALSSGSKSSSQGAPGVPTPPSKPQSMTLPKIDTGPAPGPASTPQSAMAAASKPSAPLPPKKPESMTLPKIDTGPAPGPASVPNPKVDAPTPPVRPSTPAPAPMQNPDQNITKQKALKESIQVGDNKYRIV